MTYLMADHGIHFTLREPLTPRYPVGIGPIAPDHIISSLFGPSLTIPVVPGKLRIGVWQRVLLVECNGPRERDCIVTLLY